MGKIVNFLDRHPRLSRGMTFIARHNLHWIVYCIGAGLHAAWYANNWYMALAAVMAALYFKRDADAGHYYRELDKAEFALMKAKSDSRYWEKGYRALAKRLGVTVEGR